VGYAQGLLGVKGTKKPSRSFPTNCSVFKISAVQIHHIFLPSKFPFVHTEEKQCKI